MQRMKQWDGKIEIRSIFSSLSSAFWHDKGLQILIHGRQITPLCRDKDNSLAYDDIGSLETNGNSFIYTEITAAVSAPE